MNNGKVRIYELSKELNLENKDILEICEKINISVKSHSSTITESDAERIKAAAEQYTPSVSSGKDRIHTHLEEGLDPKSTDRDKDKNKQQILAIHHKNNQTNENLSSPNIQTPLKSSNQVLANPPKLPVKPESNPEVTPSQSNRPMPIAPQLKEPPKRQSEGKNSEYKEHKEHREHKENKTEGKNHPVSKPEAPKLMGPPSRPKKESHEGKQTPSPTPPKLGKKSENAKLVLPNQSGKLNKPAAEEKTSLEVPEKKEFGENKPGFPRLNKKPQRSKAILDVKDEEIPLDLEETDPDFVASDEIVDEDILLDKDKKAPKAKLKRPNPPKKGKEKIWEDEEEGDKNAKAAKAKNKRRSKLLIEDEDDDFESELENVGIPTNISLSIARPPKPKDLNKATVTAVATTTVNKAKKPTPKSETTKTTKTEKRERNVVTGPAEQVTLSGSLTVRELADLLNVQETEIIKNLFFKGIAVNITQTLDLDTARLISEELGVKVETSQEVAAATKATEMIEDTDLENLHRRPPVVTIMGHVDHGKTTLLDSIRKTKVAQGEAGGITQHIGAYHVDIKHDDKTQQIVFLDTPGHEAFTAMRARGARVTDIAILVVAADDGVQPQTKEAISHAQAAGVPIVVAINKVDKPDAQPERVQQELTEFGLVAEDWGGDTIMVPVSALKGDNLDTLLEMILLVAEVEELNANPDRAAKGTVIEANLDRTRGPVATLLVQNGTLRVGDIIVAGSVSGKIRAMIDDRGNKVEAATPSFAVEVLGLNEVPAAGDEFDVYPTEKEARAIAEERANNQRQSRLQQAMASRRVSLSTLSEKAREGELKELNLILKADVQGSVEAILGSLQQLPQNEVQIRVLLTAAGEITETDVDLAAASGAVIVGFNTALANGARVAADREGVDIRQYNIIYKLLDDIQGAMEGLLEPEEVEEYLGQAEVRAVFSIGRGAVAGCYVQSGKIVRNSQMRVRRSGDTIYQGPLDSLKRIKEDAKEVASGYECGIGSNKFNDWKEGDVIEAYQMVMKRRTLSTN